MSRQSAARGVEPISGHGEPAVAAARPLVDRLAVQLLGVAIAYYVGARLGLMLAEVNGQVTPLWPPTGIALAAFLALGTRVWPAVAVAGFAVNASLGPVELAAAISVGNTLAPLAAYGLLRRVRFDDGLARLRDAVALVVLGALVGMSISATAGTGSLLLLGDLPASEVWNTWWVWWTGDAAGVLLFTPLLLLLREVRRIRGVGLARALEWFALLAGVFALTWASVQPEHDLLYLVVPLLIWSALRFGNGGSIPALVISVVTIDVAAGLGAGTFLGHTLLDRMVRIQAFAGVASLSALLVSAMVVERRNERIAAQRALEARVQERTEELSVKVAELESSEERFRRLVDSAPEALVVVADSGRITLANHKAALLFGYAEGELVGMTVENLVPASRRAGHVALRAGFQAHPSDRTMGVGRPLQGLRADGSEVPIEVSLSPMQGPDGPMVVVAMRDITARLKSEEAARLLRETEQRSQQALEINDHVVQGLTLAAYSLEMDDAAAARRAVAATLESAREVISNLVGPGATVVPMPEGEAGIHREPEKPAPREAVDGSRRLRAVVADDTDEVRAVIREVLETVADIDVVAEACNGQEAIDAVVEHRPDLVMLDVSMPVLNGMQALHRIRAEAPSVKVVMLSGYAHEQAAAEALGLGASAYVEKGGSLGRLVTLLDDLFPGDQEPGAAERQGDAPKARPHRTPEPSDMELDVVANYVHELRGPLTVAMGMADLLAMQAAVAEDSGDQALLDRLTGSLRRLARLLDGLSDANRIGAGDLTLTIEPVDLARLVRERVEDSAEGALYGREVRVSSDGEVLAPVDPFRVGQVVDNLLSNAAKFSPSGTPIDVRVETVHDHVEIRVSDLGPGVPADKTGLLFGKFQRLGSTAPGTGLGLYLSRTIARAHEGDLTYWEGPPCTFVVSLPKLVVSHA